MKFNKNEFGWKEKVSINTNLNNDILNIKFLPDMNTNSNMYIVNIIDLEEKTTYRVNTNINKNVLVLRYIFSDGTLKNLYSLNGKYILGKVEIYIYRKTDTLIEFDVNNIRHTCNIDEVNKTVEITKKALILNTDNAQEYTPTKDYHPATKKYVDSKFVMYESIETIYTIPMSEMQKCNNGTGRYISNIDFDELFINHEKYIYYANYKDDTLIQVTYDSKYNRLATDVLDKTSDYNIILGFDLGTHRMYPFNSGSPGVKAYQFTNDLIIKRVPILNVNEVATKKYVDDSIANIEITGGSNINDTTASATTTYSSNKIESIKENLSSQINEIVNNGNATLNKIEVLEEDPTDNLYEGRIWLYKQPDLSCTSITLDQTNVELTANNKTVTLVATVEPSNTTDNITWSSSTPEVATVVNGLVTAKSNGSAIITASCGSQSATCNIAVSGFVVQEVSNLVLSLSGSNFTNSPQTTTLPDNSGNNNDVTASGFDYTSTSGSNGNGGIVFDGMNDALIIERNNISIDTSYGFTIIFKGSINNLSQANKEIVDMNMKKWESGSPGQQISLIYGYVANTMELFGDSLAFREGSQITISDTDVHTIVYSYDGSTLKGYLDGVETISVSKSITMSLPIIEIGIACSTKTSGQRKYSNITLNNFLLYNKGLTLDEITTICDNLV